MNFLRAESSDFPNPSDPRLDRWMQSLGNHEKITFMDFLIQSDTTRPLLLNLLGQEQQNYIRSVEDSLAARVRTAGPNPWTDLAITAYAQTRTEQGRIQEYYNIDNPHFAGCSPIQKLPKELILQIVRYLPRESAGALAAVNNKFGAIVRMEELQPLPLCDFNTYWKYLRLLERDIDPDLLAVACPACVRLHSVFAPGKDRNGRPCPLHQIPRPSSQMWTPFGRPRVSLTYNFVRALASQKAHGVAGAGNCPRLLNHVSETMTDHTKFRKAAFTSDPCFTTGGELVIHNQVIFAPHGQVGGVTGKSFSFLLLCIVHGIKPCRHLNWTYAGAFDFAPRNGKDNGKSALLIRFGKDIIPPALAQQILGANSLNYGILFGDGTPISARTTSCSQCPTVCSFEAQDVPGVGRVILFKTQRNLGGWGHVSVGNSKQNGGKDGQGGVAATTLHPSKWKWETRHDFNVREAVDPRGLIAKLAGCSLQRGELDEDNFDTLDPASEFAANSPSSSGSFPPDTRSFQQLVDLLNSTVD